MFEDDSWLDAGVEAEDDAPAMKPRHPWFDYVGLDPDGRARGSTPAPTAPYGEAKSS